jgi:hypothetical protein
MNQAVRFAGEIKPRGVDKKLNRVPSTGTYFK